MLSRLNSSSEVSLLPTGLGNHYTSSSQHLIPEGRRRFPYNHSVSSGSETGDINAPEANMSFREQQEYFGPDVLVIIGLVLACFGAILTLISFYCHFKHPAIEATMAGIGPSLVGIGLLFCVLRLFFCSFFISRTCCECIADGLRFLVLRCPCCRKPKNKKIHPLRVKDIKPTINGTAAPVPTSKFLNNNKVNGFNRPLAETPNVEMLPPIHESEEQKSHEDSSGYFNEEETKIEEEEENILRDEINLLDEIKPDDSPNSDKSLHKNINELVLKSQKRY